MWTLFRLAVGFHLYSLVVANGKAAVHPVSVSTMDSWLTKASLWLTISHVIPLLLNLAAILIVIKNIRVVNRFGALCDILSNSARWLSRTSIRVGLGPNAKKAIADYAKEKPELARLWSHSAT